MKGQDRGRRFVPEIGTIYQNRGGGEYICTGTAGGYDATMERIKDGWQLLAHGLLMYEDGTIEWDYSTGGRFIRGY